jgi:hypothetical protein
MVIRNLTLSLLFIFPLISSVAFSKEAKYLCITEVSSGLIYKNGNWQSTSFKSGEKYILNMLNGKLKSVKLFGAPDEFLIENCHAISTSSSYICSDNFDSFRFQKSTKRFVMSKTTGYTSEYEELGIKISPTSLTPNISIGLCESL